MPLEWNGLLHLDEDAREGLTQLLWKGNRPKDLSLRVWVRLLRGELTKMSGHTMACLIEGFGFSNIRGLLESEYGFESTIFEAWKVIGDLTETGPLAEETIGWYEHELN